jgi:hypothetical protein
MSMGFKIKKNHPAVCELAHAEQSMCEYYNTEQCNGNGHCPCSYNFTPGYDYYPVKVLDTSTGEIQYMAGFECDEDPSYIVGTLFSDCEIIE